ncbi:hypothetical protein AMTRI_Chr01g133260 [Amborella trichopoda]
MNILSWNIRGLDHPSRKRDVRILVTKIRSAVLLLQETKFGVPGDVAFCGVDACGTSGGLWVLWDPLVLVMLLSRISSY